MNRSRRVVASRAPVDLAAWPGSTRMPPDDDLVTGVRRLAAEGDVVVAGSTHIGHELARAGAVDEYRLVVVPTVVGAGRRAFPDGVACDLTLRTSEPVAAGLRLVYDVTRAR